MAYKLDKIRKDRISEIDDLLAMFPSQLGLEDILNQDYSLITDLANVRDEKNTERLAKQKKINTSPTTLLENVTGVKNSNRENATKPSVSKNKKRSV